MKENIKVFCLIVIAASTFVLAVIKILEVAGTFQSDEHESSAAHLPHDEAAKASQPIANQPITNISFAEILHDFGDVKEGEKVKHTFTFTNVGSHPLLISNAAASCGCTVPSWSKEPIAPGGTGTIEVEYNSAGKSGLENKTVTVTANTNPSQTILKIAANVIEK